MILKASRIEDDGVSDSLVMLVEEIDELSHAIENVLMRLLK